jgi:hypothetical protein
MLITKSNNHPILVWTNVGQLLSFDVLTQVIAQVCNWVLITYQPIIEFSNFDNLLGRLEFHRSK